MLCDQHVVMKSEVVRQRLIESTGIDFSAYQHEELVDALDVTSSMFDSIRRATMWAAAALGLAVVVIWLAWRGDAGVLSTVLLALIALVAVGAFGGAVWVRSLGKGLETQTYDLLRVAAESAGRISDDLGRADPSPTDRQLADGLLLVAAIPALGSAVRRRLWLVGKPLAALSELVMANLFGRMTAQLEDGTRSSALVGSVAGQLENLVGGLSKLAGPILERFGRWVISPLTIVFGSVALTAAVLFMILAVKLG